MKTSKDMTNLEIAELLRAVAAAYQLKDKDKNKFKIIAYERAADAVEHASSELKDLWDEGKLEDVPGIGKAIAEHLGELFSKGESKHFKDVMRGIPEAAFKLMELQGVGAKTSIKLVDKLKLASEKNPLQALEKAASKGKVASIEGFGEESQKDILRSLEEMKGKSKRFLLPYAEEIAKGILEWLKKEKSVKRADPLGSLRRKASTIGDIDIAVATDEPIKVLEHFCQYPKKVRILEKGIATASIILPGGVQVDVMVQPPDSYGALLQHFTGSKHHNIALRDYALKKEMSLSEYGIKFKNKNSKIKNYSSEEEFYKALGMDWIPPELREDTGEIEAAIDGKLPKLVELSQIKCDLQIHSSFDIETSHDLGESSMLEVVEEANTLGYEYLAFTEHNPSKSGHNEREVIEIVKKKKEAVEKLNYSLVNKSARLRETSARQVKKVFNSLEIDILPDGGLAMPEKGFEYLDFALVSIHSSFRMSKGEMTKRVLNALAYPKVKIFAHPTARKINEREGIEVDWPAIFAYCLKNDKWIEINADPMRLDLPDFLVHEAIKVGLKLTLGTDAHHKAGLRNMIYGVSVARRGWAEKADIVNTRSLKEFESMIK